MREQRGSLTALDASDFCVDGTKTKSRATGTFAQLGNVICITIQNDPADTRMHGSASNLRQGCTADGFEHNGVGAIFGSDLNGFEDLRALINGVCFGVDGLQLDTEILRGKSRGIGLLELIVIFAGGERKKKLQISHEVTECPFSLRYTRRDGERAQSELRTWSFLGSNACHKKAAARWGAGEERVCAKSLKASISLSLAEYKPVFYMTLQVERQRRRGKAIALLYREAAPVASLTYLNSAGSAGTLRQFPSLLLLTTQAIFIGRDSRRLRPRDVYREKPHNLISLERDAI